MFYCQKLYCNLVIVVMASSMFGSKEEDKREQLEEQDEIVPSPSGLGRVASKGERAQGEERAGSRAE